MAASNYSGSTLSVKGSVPTEVWEQILADVPKKGSTTVWLLSAVSARDTQCGTTRNIDLQDQNSIAQQDALRVFCRNNKLACYCIVDAEGMELLEEALDHPAYQLVRGQNCTLEVNILLQPGRSATLDGYCIWAALFAGANPRIHHNTSIQYHVSQEHLGIAQSIRIKMEAVEQMARKELRELNSCTKNGLSAGRTVRQTVSQQIRDRVQSSIARLVEDAVCPFVDEEAVRLMYAKPTDCPAWKSNMNRVARGYDATYEMLHGDRRPSSENEEQFMKILREEQEADVDKQRVLEEASMQDT